MSSHLTLPTTSSGGLPPSNHSPPNRIIFLDIDGPLIPGSACFMPGQTHPFTKLSPVCVGIINKLREELNALFVIHSSWILVNPLDAVFYDPVMGDYISVKDHLINEGVANYFHKDYYVDYKSRSDRWIAISNWMKSHNIDSKDIVIFDDDTPPKEWQYADRHIFVDYFSGLLLNHYNKALDLFQLLYHGTE